MSYIGRVQIDTGNSMLVGSTMFGICESAATDTLKIINDSTNRTIGSDFDTLMRGLTIHVRFMNGNSAKSIQLQVGGTLAINVFGDFTCDAGAVVAFTLEQTAEETYWILNTTHKELGSAAYTDASDYATAAQGTLAENAMPKSGGAFTGPVTLAGAPTSDLGAVTKKYVDDAISSGMTSIVPVMHFQGAIAGDTLPDADTSFSTYESGDVILLGQKEYVYYKGATASDSYWVLLGDEGSYALKTNTTNVGSASGWSAGRAAKLADNNIDADDITAWDPGSAATLGADISADSIDSWDAGSSTGAAVANGVLTITTGVAPTLSHTSKQIPNVTNVGTAPTLTYTARSIPNVIDEGEAPTLTVTSVEVVIP